MIRGGATIIPISIGSRTSSPCSDGVAELLPCHASHSQIGSQHIRSRAGLNQTVAATTRPRGAEPMETTQFYSPWTVRGEVLW